MTKATKDQIRALLRVVEEFRSLDPDMPVQQLATFLNVALRKNPTVVEVGNLTGQTSSSTTRNLQALTKLHRTGKAGLDIVSLEPDPEDGRFKRCYLTPKGETLLNKLSTHVEKLKVTAD